VEHEVGDRQGSLIDKKVVVIDLVEGRKVVTKGADELRRVTSCFPGGEPFRVDGCQSVYFVAASVWDAVCCIADGADERDKVGGVGSF
jgi:hypothetical protein